MVRWMLALAMTAACGNDSAGPAGGADGGGPGRDAGDSERPPPTALEHRYTEYLGKLTGSTLNPVAPVGMSGTDLGVAFARDGAVAILFGDAWLDDRDSMALAPLAPPEDRPPDITWVTRDGGEFQPLSVAGVDLGAFNVPVDAVPAGDTTYYFFSTGYDFDTGRHSHSVLAHGPALAIDGLVLDHMEPSEKFINVAVVVDGDVAWIFGSGPYRSSPVYLARVELERIADRAAWRYAPDFAAGEASAGPLLPVDCVGELSVRRYLGLWLMAYNCNAPRGIHLRTAIAPTGPWSEPMLVYTPDMGYQQFIHARESEVGHDDGLSDPGREEEWGGEYGPYLVPEWSTSPAPGVHAIVYTLSSWNPYQVHLVQSVLVEPGVEIEPPAPGEGLPPARLVNGDFAAGSLDGWHASGDPFAVFQRPDGAWRVTTHGAAGDGTKGELWQEFTVDAATSELRFLLHGGDAGVELRHGAEVIRRSRGRRDNETEVEVSWRLENYRGETLRLVITDDLTGAWGFVGAGAFGLH